MARTRIKERPWTPARIAEPVALPTRTDESEPVRECVGCYRIGIPDAHVSGGYVWMCRSVVESRRVSVARSTSPDLCPICVDALS